MAVRVLLRICVGFAVAAFFVTVAYAAEPDRVSLSEQTISWSTVKYATNADNSFVDGSFDKTTIVERTFRAHVLENRYLKVTLVPGIRRADSVHHLQADRPRTALSHRSRRTLWHEGRRVLLRLADGLWRHLPDVSGCRARQDLAEAVGFQGGEGERRRSDGGDVAQGRCCVFRGAKTVRPGLDGNRGDLLCHAESRSCRARCAHGAEKPERHRDRLRILDLHDAGAGIGPEPSQSHRRRRNHRADRGLQHAALVGQSVQRRHAARAKESFISKNCATSGTGRQWASPMRRRTCRAEISGA